MYSVVNNTAYVTGDFGKYGRRIKDYSVRYGRNSVDNQKHYISNYVQPSVQMNYRKVDFSPVCKIGFINKFADFVRSMIFNAQIKKLDKQIKKMEEYESRRTPVNFVRKYMPGNIENGEINTQALMGDAYEEMERRTSVSTSEITKTIQQIDSEMSAEALDINDDGNIDIGEYAASVLATDALSESGEFSIQKEDINGVITNSGENSAVALYTNKNKDAAKEIFAKLYTYYKLDEAQKEFLSKTNNLAK